MKYRTGNEIRQLFLDFFKSKSHTIEPSASLVPVEDPTLLWINSGVAALKKYFDGSARPNNPRITNAQKSIRTNDIENVGKTARHHTFFEMLGNFSIGDYFKHDAIHFAYEFLTSEEWMGLDKSKIYITVHPDDHEAYAIWTSIDGVIPEHILRTPENFWQIGEGPCGPNSEIFYDRGLSYDPEEIGEKLFFDELENDRYVEVWNLVFSQYNAQDSLERSDYPELPHKNIDTGMGLERLVAIVQDKKTNFDTDLFMPVMDAVAILSKATYLQEPLAYKVIADHIRTITFALADGALFSNEGRGYVLRRILRRASRFGIKLGIEGSFLYTLVPVVSDMMGEYYQYLDEKIEYIQRLVQREETKFMQTLNEGERLLNQMIQNHVLSGEDAFKLYDTYGFPIELTLEICEEQAVSLDIEGFHVAMQQQKERARNSRKDVESMKSQSKDLLDFYETSTFDYNPTPVHAKVIGLFQDGQAVDQLSGKGEVVFDHTIFYAESGGQVSDKGYVESETAHGKVVDVQKAPNGQFLHTINLEGELSIGDQLYLVVDLDLRKQTEANHTATHLLQQALIDVLGTHISQAGSFVSSEYARFDFTHFEKLTKEQMDAVETKVNEAIFAQLPVDIQVLPIEEAKNIGARAFFNEKYGDMVRVVSAGNYSIEFCGGSHVTSTGVIGLFKIESESSIGSGIRRIEAVTGFKAFNLMNQKQKTLEEIADTLKLNSIDQVSIKVEQLVHELTDARKENERLTSSLFNYQAKSLVSEAEKINELSVLIHVLKDDQVKLKDLALSLKDQLGSGIVCLMNDTDRLSYVVAVSDDVIAKGFKAGELVKTLASLTNGKGGGKPDVAQGGGQLDGSIQALIDEFKNKLR